MTSRDTLPEYEVSKQSVGPAGSGLVKATYAGYSDEMLPFLSLAKASEVLGLSLFPAISQLQGICLAVSLY